MLDIIVCVKFAVYCQLIGAYVVREGIFLRRCDAAGTLDCRV